jgi:hypothetical protein
MAVLALILGGGFALQFMRKNKVDDDDEEDFEDDLEIESPPVADENNVTNRPALGVPCINWGGLDNGHRMKSEIRSGDIE